MSFDQYLEELTKQAHVNEQADKLEGLSLEQLARLAGLDKLAGDMPPFLKQDRPAKVKDIYRALKRDHPDMPAEVKARIASRKGKSSPKSRKPPESGGPAYKAPLHYERKGETYKKASALYKVGAESDVPATAEELTRRLHANRPDSSEKMPNNEQDATPKPATYGILPTNLNDPTTTTNPMGEANPAKISSVMKKLSSWDQILSKIAQDVTPEDIQEEAMRADPGVQAKRQGLAGLVAGGALGGAAGLPLYRALPKRWSVGARALAPLALAAGGALGGGVLGARRGIQQAEQAGAFQNILQGGRLPAYEQMEGTPSPFEPKTAGVADMLTAVAKHPSFLGGVLGGAGGAGIGYATSPSREHRIRNLLIGALTGATLGAGGGALASAFGHGTNLGLQDAKQLAAAAEARAQQAADTLERGQKMLEQSSARLLEKGIETGRKRQIEELTSELSAGRAARDMLANILERIGLA